MLVEKEEHAHLARLRYASAARLAPRGAAFGFLPAERESRTHRTHRAAAPPPPPLKRNETRVSRAPRPPARYLSTLPTVAAALEVFAEELVGKEKARKKAIEEAKQRSIELAAKRAADEERLRLEEKKRKEKEKAQRKMRDDIGVFENKLRAWKKELAEPDKPFKFSETGYKKSMDVLQNLLDEHRQEMNRAKHMRSVATQHEVEGEMKKPEGLLGEIETMLSQYTMLWTYDKDLAEYIAQSRDTQWSELNVEELEEGAKGLAMKIKKCHKSVKTTDAFVVLDKTAKNFYNSCPLVTSLHSQAMRERHWDELITATGVDIESPLQNAMLTLDEILSLELHLPARAVIVEEMTRQGASRRRSRRRRSPRSRRRGRHRLRHGPVRQGPGACRCSRWARRTSSSSRRTCSRCRRMVARATSTSSRRSIEWQKALVTASDVSHDPLGAPAHVVVPRAALHRLGRGQARAARGRPSASPAIDSRGARDAQGARGTTKNVKDASQREGLLKRLEASAQEQELCKKSLTDFLDAKRRQFARFYFTSEADLLDILSNGSNPHLIMKHVDKVMLATAGLTLTDEDPVSMAEKRPSAVNYISGVGKECANFDKPVPLLGKVEIYLEDILREQKNALDSNAKASYKRYMTQVDQAKIGAGRGDWLLDVSTQTGKADASDAAQIVLLVAAVTYVQEATKAMVEIKGGDKDGMTKHYTRVAEQLKELVLLTKGELTKVARTKVMCMITLDAHSRDIIDKLIRQDAAYVESFQWKSQIKQQPPRDEKTFKESTQIEVRSHRIAHGRTHAHTHPTVAAASWLPRPPAPPSPCSRASPLQHRHRHSDDCL